jgi:hypothetical protein
VTTRKQRQADTGTIARRDLAHAITACYRIEDEIWRRIRLVGCTESTKATPLQAALVSECATRPEWCEQEAWDRMVQAFREWSTAFGTLQRFVTLRRKRDEG